MARGVADRIESLPRRRLLILMVAVFSLVHTGYYLAGVRFDVSALTASYHLPDLRLLVTRLAQTLFYLHSQPPLFGLFAGLVLKLFPHSYPAVFQACYVSMGLGLYLSLFALMRRVGIARVPALAVGTWFMASPSFVLYEHWLYPVLPLALLLTASCLFFASALARPRFGRLLAFFGVVLAACLLHATFHLAYLVLVVVAMMVLRWRRRRTILAAALAPLLLLAALYVKNDVLFGVPAATSWLGMNLYGVTVRAMPEDTRRALVAAGKLTPLALIPRTSPLQDYPRRYTQVNGFESIPVLRQVRKASGLANLHHLAYIGISRGDLHDARYIAFHHPQYLLVGWLNAWLCYFRSGTDYAPVYGNLDRITAVNVVYDYACYGKVPRYHLRLGRLPIYFSPEGEPRLYLFLLLGLPLLVAFGLRQARRTRPDGLALGREQRLLLLYACLNILFVAVVGNACDVGENNRFRFVTDPLYALLLALALQHYLGARARARQAAGSTPSARIASPTT
jgi:hypothetical protein